MEICIVAGARPNFIKLAPIVRAIDSAHGRGVDVCHHLVYTGRKDDPALALGLNVVEGKVTYKAVADVFGMAYEHIEL